MTQQQYIRIQDQLKQGLRKSYVGDRNTYELRDLLNLRPKPEGLAALRSVSTLFSDEVLAAATDYTGVEGAAPITASFPYPQVFLCGKEPVDSTEVKGYVCTEDAIYEWYDGADAPLVKVRTYSATAPATATDIEVGGRWQFVDLLGSCLFTNGTNVVIRTNFHNVTDIDGLDIPDRWLVSDLAVNSICFYRGNTLFGGFSVDDTNPLLSGLRGQDMFFASPMGGDVFWMFISDLYDTSTLHDLYESMAIGSVTTPGLGTIQMQLPLRGSVMVYGSEGVAISKRVNEPAGVFGMELIKKVGVPGRGAVWGTPDMHLFIDTAGELYRVDGSGKVGKVGYQEYLLPLLEEKGETNNVHIEYDPREEEWYISNGTLSYIVNAYGMCRTNKATYGLVYMPHQGSDDIAEHAQLLGFQDTLEKGRENLVRVQLGVTDFDNRGLKMLQEVEVAADDISPMYVWLERNVDSQYFNTQTAKLAYDATLPFDCNERGTATVNEGAVNFVVYVEGIADTYARMDYIILRWKQMDFRGIRGRY